MDLQTIRSELNFNGIAVLYRIARLLSSAGQLHFFISEVLRILESQAGMKRGMISILSTDSSELMVEVAHSIPDYLRIKGKYRLGEGITGQVVKSGRPVAIPRLKNEPTFLDRTGARKDLRLADLAFLCVPIKIGDSVLGALSVDRLSVENESTLEGELKFLEAVGDLIAKAVYQRRSQTEAVSALEKENLELRRRLESRGQPDEMIGNSSSMREVYRYIAQVASFMTTVLIRGETGTGKELVAQAIHKKSQLRDGPFIALNCAALSNTLLESELFGHEKGAFTNAINSRIGKFEAAHNGTLFLDEIGELSIGAQGKLLRAIQEKEIQRVGGMDSVRVNTRVIAATNRNLEDDVQNRKFREDLYYRLNVFTIAIPPLRERGADILLLSDHFVKKYSKLQNRIIERISTPAIEMLSSYKWPGNVRELENVIERAILVTEGNVIDAHDFPAVIQQSFLEHGSAKRGSFENIVAAYEKELIIDALKDSNGNQTDAATLLKTTKRIIQYKVDKYQIDYKKYRKNK